MDTKITLKDGQVIQLNERLIDRQRLTSREVEQIKKVHFTKSEVFEKMRETSDRVLLRKLAEEVTELEFKLQRLWGFELNKNWHEWYSVPKCSCPKIDNYELRGQDMKIYSSHCSVHGS